MESENRFRVVGYLHDAVNTVSRRAREGALPCVIVTLRLLLLIYLLTASEEEEEEEEKQKQHHQCTTLGKSASGDMEREREVVR